MTPVSNVQDTIDTAKAEGYPLDLFDENLDIEVLESFLRAYRQGLETDEVKEVCDFEKFSFTQVEDALNLISEGFAIADLKPLLKPELSDPDNWDQIDHIAWALEADLDAEKLSDPDLTDDEVRKLYAEMLSEKSVPFC